MRITKHSKQWWNDECGWALDKYRMTRSPENWKIYKKVVKTTKRSFFNNKIQEVVNKSRGLWELMDWANKRKLSATEAIKNHVSSPIAFGKPFIPHSIPCFTDKLMLKSLNRLATNWWLFGICFPKKNSDKL